MADTFNSLPIEVNQMIAAQLESDKDLGNFRGICLVTKYCIDSDHGSFWRVRLQSKYDLPAYSQTISRDQANERLRLKYQQRKKYIIRGTNFASGGTRTRESKCLQALRELILESFSNSKAGPDGGLISRNMERIEQFCDSFDLLRTIFHQLKLREEKTANPLYFTIIATLSHLCLKLPGPSDTAHVYQFPASQQVAYASCESRPIFSGPPGAEIDMDWVVHMVNFWRYHMTRREEVSLYNDYSSLPENYRPHGWRNELTDGTHTLSKHWKGSYAFVDPSEIRTIRSGLNWDETVIDQTNNEESSTGFQSLRLAFGQTGRTDASATRWPALFEHHLQSLVPPSPPRPRTRAQQRRSPPSSSSAAATAPAPAAPISFHFTGKGEDNESFQAQGWLNPLPRQSGIPGYMRMTMMKYYLDPDTGVRDDDALWCYEGVVLPGGMIMLGRWWSPDRGYGTQEEYSGPFIFWSVDQDGGEGEEDGKNGEE